MFKVKNLIAITDALRAESKCAKHKVACLIAEGTRILATGVNGTRPGSNNCCDVWADTDLSVEPYRTKHREWAISNELHAETNAINRLPFEYKGALHLSTAIVTRNPCPNCAALLVRNGINSVNVITGFYDLVPDEALHNVPVVFWVSSPSGFKMESVWFRGESIEIKSVARTLNIPIDTLQGGEVAYNVISDSIRNHY